MESGKYFKRLSGLMAAALFLTSCGMSTKEDEKGGAAEPDENIMAEISDPGEQSGDIISEFSDINMLMDADFLLYNVDCAAKYSASFNEKEHQGLFQSVSDQEYGSDAGTGKKWGYRFSEYLIQEEDDQGIGFTTTKWGIDRDTDTEADIGQADICYDFEVPNGNYEITVGFFNPFGTRKIDVDCEEEQRVAGEKLLRFQLIEKQFQSKVEDGTLNLRVYNSQGKNFMDTPILSYIRIAVVPEYDKELLEAALERMIPIEGDGAYTTDSYAAYQYAFEEAKQLTEGYEEAENDDYKEKYNNLKEAFLMLVKTNRYDSFSPGEEWNDTENTRIQAHGGQVQQMTWTDENGETVEKWVWVGEDKTLGYRGGICAYSSDDLYNWQFEGVIMRNVPSREALDTDSYFKEVYAEYTPEQLDNVFMSLDAERAVIERPKLIYNEKTKQYVLWFHADGPTKESDANYAAACAGVAVSDSPFGPFRFVDRYRLNVCPPDQEDQAPQSKGMARDMNLFKDTDGTAYIIYSSEENLTMYISKLNEEYTYLATDPDKAVCGEDFVRLFPGAQREAPALFLKDGKYYLLTSGCTGWAPNQAGYYVADSIFGEWTPMGDPCVGDEEHTTFFSQSTCVFREPESDTWIYMGDRWNEYDLGDSRYIWLPLEFDKDGVMSISFQDEWKLDVH